MNLIDDEEFMVKLFGMEKERFNELLSNRLKMAGILSSNKNIESVAMKNDIKDEEQ